VIGRFFNFSISNCIHFLNIYSYKNACWTQSGYLFSFKTTESSFSYLLDRYVQAANKGKDKMLTFGRNQATPDTGCWEIRLILLDPVNFVCKMLYYYY